MPPCRNYQTTRRFVDWFSSSIQICAAAILCVFALVLTLPAAAELPAEIPPGFPCELIPNFCDRVHCLDPEDCSGGIIVKGGGNCGCCDVCVRYEGYTDSCTNAAPDPAVIPPNTFTQYYFYDDTCEPALVCGSNKECTNTGGKSCPEMQTDETVAVYTEPPKCDFYGDFALKRCKGLAGDNPRCFCVDKNGTTIFGRLPTGSDNVTCACSRAFDTQSPTSEAGRFIRCEETGDFSELQCWNGVCFCVNKLTSMMTSAAVTLHAISALPCYVAPTYGDSYYSPCEQELYKMNTIIKEFLMKGVQVKDIDTTNCDPDGSYAPVQYSGDKWFCADRDGAQILSYLTQSADDYATMLCNCARDQYYPDGLPDNARGRNCIPDGNYQTVTPKCVDSTCYCLDSDGQRDSCDFPRSDTMTCPVTDTKTCIKN